MAVGTIEHVLTLDCPESPGIVYAVAGFLVEHGCDIIDNQQFGDRRDEHFYMRVHVVSACDDELTARLRDEFTVIAQRFEMSWRLDPRHLRRRVLVMVSKFAHCLNDLLFRARNGDLPIDVVAVVSNHRDHEHLVDWYDVPFFHIPVTADTKPAAERALLKIVADLDADLVVLARYMQVLTDQTCRQLTGRAINIHHSFLPGFKGARPYHQAYERGVKLVGATAHYVTPDLDEGLIIAQQVIEVNHSHAPEDLIAVGRDAECAALIKAVRWHCEGRVIARGRRTVVLR